MDIVSFIVSHIGTTRQNHEDNFLVNGKMILPELQGQMTLEKNIFVSEYAMQKNKAVFAVSDGMGGHNSGEIASFMAVSLLSKAAQEILSFRNIEDSVQKCTESINNINSAIKKQGDEHPEMFNMGATITALIVNDDKIAILNAGDSRAYRYSGNKITQITKDNTEGQRLIDLKLLTPEEAENFPSRKALTRYLGMNTGEGKLKADVSFIKDLMPKEWFILCSDGLYDVIEDEEIEEILKNKFLNSDIKSATKQLVNTAITGINGRRASKDNITVMIIEIKA